MIGFFLDEKWEKEIVMRWIVEGLVGKHDSLNTEGREMIRGLTCRVKSFR